MNLVWNEYIEFLKDKGINTKELGLKEGYYWLDRQIIKAYDKQGNIHKIARLLIDDDLNITVKTIYKNKPFEIESWQETVERNKDRLEKLELESWTMITRELIKHKDYAPIILSSGGKDSSVVTYLVREIFNNAKIIFNNTTLDCAETYLHIKSLNNVQIINPKEGFYQWRERNNFIGNRMARACCQIFKENETIKQLPKEDKYLFFMGMRNEESNTRANYEDLWKNEKWGNRDWLGVLPIRKWTEEEVWLYVLWRNIDINKKYKYGYSRCGCNIACPFYSKSTWVLDKHWYPFQYKRWHDILQRDFVDNNKALIMNCTSSEYHLNWNGGIVREEPTEEVVQEFADANGLDHKVARRYFSHCCEDCGKRVKVKEVLSMNMKYNGRNTVKFYCKKDLMKRLNITNEQWNDRVEEFKEQGCSLF